MAVKSQKLIPLIAILIIIGGLTYWWITGWKSGGVTFSDKDLESLPLAEREEAIKIDSFITDLKETLAKFTGVLLYDENQNEFKLTSDSSPTLEATYYGVQIIQGLKMNPNQKITPEAILEKVRSYYVPAGYYSEEGKEPVFSTGQALAINVQYQEELGQEIDFDWLESNSLENENLESAKFDPQYQMAVLDIYNNLSYIEQKEIKTRIAPLYMDYYCNYSSSEIADEDYLRQKYYQTSIISYFNGLETINNNCLKKDDVDFDKNKLIEISFNDLDDIKEVYWFYRIQKFYNLRPDLKKVIAGTEKFYLTGGFKEKMTDEKPNLIGTYYGVLFIN